MESIDILAGWLKALSGHKFQASSPHLPELTDVTDALQVGVCDRPESHPRKHFGPGTFGEFAIRGGGRRERERLLCRNSWYTQEIFLSLLFSLSLSLRRESRGDSLFSLARGARQMASRAERILATCKSFS